MSATRALAAFTIAGAAALGISGCSSHGGSNAAKKSPTETPVASGGLISPKLADIPALKKSKGIAADTTVANCTTRPGDVKASGTVTNTAKVARDLVVTMSWIAPKHSDVVARGVATMKQVKPGSTTDWSIESTLGYKAGDAQCIVGASAGQLAQ